MSNSTPTTTECTNPFPGLRPFEVDEAHLFFGREGQSDELLRRLEKTRFLAVVGTSGSGKSSLVRAGLLPALHSGYMMNEGSAWNIALMRPESDPIGNLARRLQALALTTDNSESKPTSTLDEERDMKKAILEATLHRSARGLIEATKQLQLDPHENLLVVVDQFEELFRFQQDIKGSNKDAAAFVKLLLEATVQREVPIFVVITMRSDFLGDCAQFRDLPEALNNGQYIIPRMTRDQRQASMTGPAVVGGGAMTPRLVQRLLNDLGEDPDQLPILQHFLMRLWDHWSSSVTNGKSMDMEDFTVVGELDHALSRHADETYNSLPDQRSKKLAEKLFKNLTEKDSESRGIRRPTSFGNICKLSGAGAAELGEIVKFFSEKGRSFIMAPPIKDITDDTLLDISHESLIRVWPRLRAWIEEESSSLREYRRLREVVKEWIDSGKKQDFLYRSIRLSQIKGLVNREEPNLDSTESEFLAASEKLEEQSKSKARLRKQFLWGGIIGATIIFTLLFGKFFQLATQRDAALSRELVLMAENQLSINPARSVLLATEAIKRSSTEDAWSVLRSSTRDFNLRFKLMGHSEAVWEANFSPDGELLATAGSDHEAIIWNISRGTSTGLKHKGGVNRVKFNPNGTSLVTACLDGTASLWDVKTGRHRVVLEGHSGPVVDAGFSPNSQLVVTASWDRSARIWDAITGKLVSSLLGHMDELTYASFSPDGKRVLTASGDSTARIWDAQSGRAVFTLKGHSGPVWTAKYSKDGSLILTASRDKSARVWNAANGQLVSVLRGHFAGVNTASFSTDGRYIITTSSDKTSRLWDVSTGELLSILRGHTEMVYSANFSPDGNWIVTGSFDGTARLWDTNTGEQVDIFLGHTGRVLDAVFSPDGKWVATTGQDKSVRIWMANSSHLNKTLGKRGVAVSSASFSPNERQIAIGDLSGIVSVWNRQDGNLSMELRGHKGLITSTSYSSDGAIFATSSKDGTIRTWDSHSGKNLALLEEGSLRNNTVRGVRLVQGVNSVSFNPSGDSILSASGDGSVQVWDLSTPKLIKTLESTTSPILCAAFSHNGKLIVAGSEDGLVKIWKENSGELLMDLEGHSDAISMVAFSRDDQFLFTTSRDGTGRIWDLATMSTTFELKSHSGPVHGGSISPDGIWVITAGEDKTAKIWKVSTGQLMDEIRGHAGPVLSAAFSPNGNIILTASTDGFVRIFNFNPPSSDEEILSIAQGQIDRLFGPEERKQYIPQQNSGGIFENLIQILD